MLFPERVESLRTKHENLDREVRMESRRPMPDTTTLTRLKMEKLRVKEEMDRLARA
ncbi:YdcH family protein [Niveispirillum cyanobacteriorum]|uniref:DUF465 domain-containing protein n=1 Tax=Niveispirillum cyanobacteriorum TaxID=1612173 RepID=A0A2K9NAL9_9PROT|nr:YdcH family protein [Niveispirillum cyanobacteriorum]AUN30193.1 DUF465 domain-containing protein [Niveispirillum cyanobacteriorum]MBJ7416624.1 YdcH family protein [Niveispirillum sp.]GGE57010.1 hypothetical protein GCM10011317_13780 [Niveispirillum cyanobacteriorum]